ncbi:hypothetical protein DTO271D3_4557 [Paecilomyces variotii]|nr:hypothetical protein DTO271D3_4557 [Paecilomyces variotii]
MDSRRQNALACGLPKTPAEWRQKAAREVIQAPPPSDQYDRRQPVDAPSLHVGEKAIDVPLVNLSGWNPGSKVQFSHFLTTRTLVEMANDPRDIKAPENYTDFHLTQEICREANRWLIGYGDWNVYLRDIKDTEDRIPEPGESRELGEFGNVRYRQLLAQLLPNDEQDSAPAERESNTVPYFSRIIPAGDEGIVDIGLVNFVVALTKSCQHVGLDWRCARGLVHIQVGHAHLTAQNDGRLHPRQHNDTYALLKVKPFRLADKPDSTLMEIAIQLLCWMIREDFREDHPYFTISGHREHTYLTVATFGQGYPKYISEGVVDNQEDCFLKLKSYGPFNMYSSKHVKFFGQLVLSLAIVCSEAWKAKQASSSVGAQPTIST